MKGIILAGGSGSRLYPLTRIISKQLLPVYDKPMIYYPLSLLMLAGIQEFLIITSPQDEPHFKRVLGTGESLGISISYTTQEKPNGIAQAFILGESFIGNDSVCFILGDNIFYGHGMSDLLASACQTIKGATIFGYPVQDPERFGVVEIDKDHRILSLEEKPIHPKSNLAVTGLYVYDHHVTRYAKELSPSARGELEITDLNKRYFQEGSLQYKDIGRGVAWLDTGTHESLAEASKFVELIENRQGLKIACLEEIAFRKKYISKQELLTIATEYKNEYGAYLNRIAEEPI